MIVAEQRIRRVMDELGMDYLQARSHLKQRDHHARYTRRPAPVLMPFTPRLVR